MPNSGGDRRRRGQACDVRRQMGIEQAEQAGAAEPMAKPRRKAQQRGEPGNDIGLIGAGPRRGDTCIDRGGDGAPQSAGKRNWSRAKPFGLGKGFEQRRRRHRRDQQLSTPAFGIEPVLEWTPRIVEHALAGLDRALVAGLPHEAAAAALKIEHELVGAGTADEPRVAAIALRTGIEAHQLGGAELDEVEMPADLGGSERPGLDRRKGPRDRISPERLALGRADRVGGDAGRHRSQDPSCGSFNLPGIGRPDKREKLAGSFKTWVRAGPILPGTSVSVLKLGLEPRP